MEELPIGACPDRIDYSGFQVHKDAAWHVFSRTRFAEKRVKSIISAAYGLVRRHLAVWLNTMFKAEQLPACIPDLHAGLTDVDTEALTHGCGSGEVDAAEL